jgi:hypothetical protein
MGTILYKLVGSFQRCVERTATCFTCTVAIKESCSVKCDHPWVWTTAERTVRFIHSYYIKVLTIYVCNVIKLCDVSLLISEERAY